MGVDLAAQAAGTVSVVIEGGPGPRVVGFDTFCDDDTLVRLAGAASKIAVDCPLG